MTTHGNAATRPLVVDALEYSRPERARFEEWRAGNVGCVHVTLAIWENARQTISVIGDWHQLLEQNRDLIALARTVDDIEEIASSGRTAVVFGFQNASPLEDDLDLVRAFHDMGVRIVQLTYNIQNNVASGCWEENDSGLSTHFGRNLVREMNRVGMLIDVSHCGERSCFDAIEWSSKPVAITHANPAEFVGDEIELNRRTKSTALLKELTRRGGVVGLSMYPLMTPGGSASSVETFCEMVAWTVELLGVDAVGVGTDYYTGYSDSIIKWWRAGRWARQSPVPITGGIAEWPQWFRSPAQFPTLLDGLTARGFSDDEVAKITGGNWLCLFRATFEPAS